MSSEDPDSGAWLWLIALVVILAVAASAAAAFWAYKKYGGAGEGGAAQGSAGEAPLANAGRVLQAQQQDVPLSNLVVRDPFVVSKKRGPLKNKWETQQFVVFWDAPLEGKTDAQTLQAVKDLGQRAEACWAAYAKAGFVQHNLKQTGQDTWKKTIFLSGCKSQCALGTPKQEPSFDFQGWESGQTYFSGGFDTAPHELGHMRQACSGGFSNNVSPAVGAKLGWAWEASANYMAMCCGVPGVVPEGSAMEVWFDLHPLSLELWDGKDGYPYGAWPFFLWADTKFGFGTVGKMWSEARRDAAGTCTELVPECLGRLTGKDLPTLFGDWLASTLTFSYFKDPKFAQMARDMKLEGGWNAFDALTLEGTRLHATSARPLQAFGFHALRLDAARFGGKKLRLDAAVDAPSWRMVVVNAGKQPQILPAGALSPPIESGGAVLGIITTTRGALPKSGAYSVALM